MSIKSDLPKIDVAVPFHPFADLNIPKFYTWQLAAAFEEAVLNLGFPSGDDTAYVLFCESDRLTFRHGGLGEFLAIWKTASEILFCPRVIYASSRVVKSGQVIMGNNRGLFAEIVGNWSASNNAHKSAPTINNNCIDTRMGYTPQDRRRRSCKYFFRYQLSVAISAIIASGANYDDMFIAVSDGLRDRVFGFRSGDMIGAYTPRPELETIGGIWESRVEFMGKAQGEDVFVWNRSGRASVTVIGDWSR